MRSILTQDEAVSLGTKLLGMVSDKSIGIMLEHTIRSVVKIANGRPLASDDGDEIGIKFFSTLGSGIQVTVGTNQINEDMLQRIVGHVKRAAPLKSDFGYGTDSDPDDPKYWTFNKKEYLPVSLWYDRTVDAIDRQSSDVLESLVSGTQSSGLNSTATVGITARSILYLYEAGMTAYTKETNSEVTVTARTKDGKASGWGGQVTRDWSEIDPANVLRSAMDIAERSRNPVALEPGRRLVILGPTAVAQFALRMASLYNAESTDRGITPFSLFEGERTNKIGLHVFDRRLKIESDPGDRESGFPPFMEWSGNGYPGFPVPKMTWVEDGILKNLAYSVMYGVSRGKVPCENPFSVRISSMPGVAISTINEMIANCKEGLYVNRFSDLTIVHGQSGLMTGVTRDGCFYIKDGKIQKPIKNLRFVESPFFAFNSIEMIGTPARAAFGYMPPSNREFTRFDSWPAMGRATKWPRPPVVVPAMMIRDFNFTSLSDAI